jgi:hypothetical protein
METKAPNRQLGHAIKPPSLKGHVGSKTTYQNRDLFFQRCYWGPWAELPSRPFLHRKERIQYKTEKSFWNLRCVEGMVVERWKFDPPKADGACLPPASLNFMCLKLACLFN